MVPGSKTAAIAAGGLEIQVRVDGVKDSLGDPYAGQDTWRLGLDPGKGGELGTHGRLTGDVAGADVFSESTLDQLRDHGVTKTRSGRRGPAFRQALRPRRDRPAGRCVRAIDSTGEGGPDR